MILQRFLIAFALIGLVSACASSGKPDRRGNRGGDRPETASTIPFQYAKPISFILVGFDSDQNKIISESEVAEGALAEWALATREAGSAQLSPIDFRKWMENTLGSHTLSFTHIALDTDQSGSVDEIEFQTALVREFNLADKNEDGLLTRSELLDEFIPRRRGNNSDNGANGQRRPNGRGRGGGGGRRPRN